VNVALPHRLRQTVAPKRLACLWQWRKLSRFDQNIVECFFILAKRLSIDSYAQKEKYR